MNYALILAAGVGQRMRSSGLPKQFLKLFGKPIIIYTLEKFEQTADINRIVIVCREGYTDYLNNLLDLYHITKTKKIIVGGMERQSSLKKGLNAIKEMGGKDDDVVVIHDGVRPLVSIAAISENVRVAKEYGSAITVRPVTESVVITADNNALMNNFQKRADTYSLTSPQSFRLGKILSAYENEQAEKSVNEQIPLLDAAMVYAASGEKVHLVKEQNKNLKITTPEDFYYLKAMLEMEENRIVFGL